MQRKKVKAAKPRFRCGDVVQSIGGGPRMTVERVGPDAPDGSAWFYVTWFDSNDHLHRDLLLAKTLVLRQRHP
jgi:uncharacterized protein YodC (DUF2158 family)